MAKKRINKKAPLTDAQKQRRYRLKKERDLYKAANAEVEDETLTAEDYKQYDRNVEKTRKELHEYIDRLSDISIYAIRPLLRLVTAYIRDDDLLDELRGLDFDIPEDLYLKESE